MTQTVNIEQETFLAQHGRRNYFVYMLTNADRHTVLYIGITNDLERRASEHSLGEGGAFARKHNAHKLVSRAPVLTQGFACYRMYETGDGRHVTVGALEPKFFARLCELLGRPELAERQYADDQMSLADELADVFRSRPLHAWLDAFDGEDVCVGPVATFAEAEAELG